MPVGGTSLLKSLLEQLVRCDPRRTCNVVIVAPSGSGKSTLIGRLLSNTVVASEPAIEGSVIESIVRGCLPNLSDEDSSYIEGLLGERAVGPFDQALLLQEKDRFAETANYLPPRWVRKHHDAPSHGQERISPVTENYFCLRPFTRLLVSPVVVHAHLLLPLVLGSH